MNKTFCKKSKFIYFLFAGCLILFNLCFLGCGLDTFYVIDPPSIRHEPVYSSMMADENYFEFRTVENDDYEGITFLGTEVYYKIYNSTSKLISEYSSINSAASNETTANQSASRLIETYKYQPLRSSDETGANILIKTTNNSRNVKIRLSDYPEYPAELIIDGASKGIPVRSIPKNPSFNFKSYIGNTDSLPKSGDTPDDDYAYTSTTESIDEYYVAMFAVSVARDITYSHVYSNTVYLGSVTISLVD